MNPDISPYLHNPMYPAHHLCATEIATLVRKQSRLNRYADLQGPSARQARLLRKLNEITGRRPTYIVSTISIIRLP